MRLQGELTIDSRLNSLLDAPSEAKAIEAFHLLWESTLVTKVRPFLLSRQIHADVRRDIEVETYLRVCQNLLLRRAQTEGVSSQVLITDIEGYTIAAARGLLYNYYLAQNPAWRRLQIRAIAHLKQGDKVSRWKQEFRWNAGLPAWKGASFRAKSGRAQAFLNDDYSAFRHKGLHNKEPAEIALPDLMCRIFHWLDSPLWQNRLVGHMLKLYGQEDALPLSWEEVSAEGEQQEASLWTEGMESAVTTRQALQQALCQDGLLNRLQRGVLLLKLDSDTLTRGLGITFSQVAASLGIELDTLIGETGETLLPLSDEKVAALLNIEDTTTMTAGARVSTYYRMAARRILEPWFKNVG